MDTLHLTNKPDSETAVTKPGKTAKRDRKEAPVTKDSPVTVTDTEPTGEDSTVTTEVPEPAAEDRTVTNDAPVTAKDTEPSAQEPSVSDPTTEVDAPTVTEPKKLTKADLAKAIYDEMVKEPNLSRTDIITRFRNEAGLTTSGAQSYYYKFQKKSGRVVEKGPTKMDKAREVFEALATEGKARKEVIAALIKDVGLTPSGASTYFQTLKRQAQKPTE